MSKSREKEKKFTRREALKYGSKVALGVQLEEQQVIILEKVMNSEEIKWMKLKNILMPQKDL